MALGEALSGERRLKRRSDGDDTCVCRAKGTGEETSPCLALCARLSLSWEERVWGAVSGLLWRMSIEVR